VVSVDILTDSEEKTLEVITGCFSQQSGVPELGLGNAEVNVVFNAWQLHLMLCQNGRSYHRKANGTQVLVWLIGVCVTAISILISSLSSGIIHQYVAGEDAQGGLLDDPTSDILGKCVLILPIILALFITILSRMGWRDKWSVCAMAADAMASEIYKFRMGAVEYDQNKPPGKDEDGNDLPPLSSKEKARLSRRIFVDRIQVFYQATLTELSQTSALRRWRGKKIAKDRSFIERVDRENKPTLREWLALKLHLEEHFHRARWNFPQGVSFLNWISGLRPYLSQRTLREELKAVIADLAEQGTVTLRGSTPLTERESKLVRRGLAKHLGLAPQQFDGVRDEIRVLQRKIVLELAQAKLMEQEAADAEGAAERDIETPGATSAGRSRVTFEGGRRKPARNQVAPSRDSVVTDPSKPGAHHGNADSLRQMLMDLQGLGQPEEEITEELTRAQKRAKKLVDRSRKDSAIDDDYLAGPLAVESYVIFRVRPVMEMLEKRATKLAFRLNLAEILIFIIQSSGAILASFEWFEWVALTVSIGAVLQGLIEYVNLRDQVTSVNLAVRELQSLLVFWDSLSIVRRRTPLVKNQIVSVTEQAVLAVTENHSTAAANTIISASKKLQSDAAEEDAAKESTQ